MPSPKKKKDQEKTKKLPKEIEDFLRKYKEWYDRHVTQFGSNPDDDPPPPPGNDDDDGD